MSESMPVFGHVATAMVTPFDAAGQLDVDKTAWLANHLVDELGNDALVVNGTTGEAPTTSDEEKRRVIETVAAQVGDRAHIIAGVGSFSTEHTIELSRQARDAGADGLLVVTPYYSRPPRDGLKAHFTAVADATQLPIMLYDIPHRTSTAIPEDLLIELADHPQIVAVKDAKQDVAQAAAVLASTNLTYYAGDDAYLLPLLAIGGAGVVGTSTHFTAPQAKAIVEAFLAGEVEQARRLNAAVLPAFRGIFAAQGCIMVKAALAAQGHDVGQCRLPMGTVDQSLARQFLSLLDY